MSDRISDIRFFDFNFNLIHTENEFLSSNWTVYYNDIGTFEAHFDLKSDTLPIVMENNFLVAVQGNLSAVVVGKKVTDELVIYGRTCNWLLTKRITDAFDSTATIDALLTEKVGQAFSDVTNFQIDIIPNLPTFTASRDDKCETFSLVQDCLHMENLGHELKFDPIKGKWIFKILKGNENNPLVISTVNRNAYDISTESDLLNLCNQGWYKKPYRNMGEWDPELNACLDSEGNIIAGSWIENARENHSVPTNYGKCWKVRFKQNPSRTSYNIFGLDLYPGDFLVCDNTKGFLKKSDNGDSFWVKVSLPSYDTGILRWEVLLSDNNESKAISTLYSMQGTNQTQGKTVGVHFGSYEEYLHNECDYTLGDIVSVEWQSGDYKERTKKRIVGVNLWYEPENIGEEPIFEDV